MNGSSERQLWMGDNAASKGEEVGLASVQTLS